MIKIYRIDINGFYIEGNDGYMYQGDTPPDDYVIDPPPQGFIRPRYVDGEWMDAGEVPPEEVPPTLEERIAQAEQRLELIGSTIEELESRVQALEGTE